MTDRQRVMKQAVLRRLNLVERNVVSGERRGGSEARESACGRRNTIPKAKIFRLHGIERRIFHFCSLPLSRHGRGRPVDGVSGSGNGASTQEHIGNIIGEKSSN
jgi:hypothetical protein